VLTVLLDWSGRREKRWRDLEPSSLLTPLDAVCGLRATLKCRFIINTVCADTRNVLDKPECAAALRSTFLDLSQWPHGDGRGAASSEQPPCAPPLTLHGCRNVTAADAPQHHHRP
jgi:hypothetical protein